MAKPAQKLEMSLWVRSFSSRMFVFAQACKIDTVGAQWSHSFIHMSLWGQLVQLEFIKNGDLIYYQQNPKCLVFWVVLFLTNW